METVAVTKPEGRIGGGGGGGGGKYDSIASEEAAEAERQVRLIASLASPALGVGMIGLLRVFTITQASRIGWTSARPMGLAGRGFLPL